MTAIYSATVGHVGFLVSDRLVTVQGNEWDAFANKALVFAGKDALVAIGYSGLAFMDGQPTDHRIAEWLIGGSIAHPGLVLDSSLESNITLWDAMRRLQDGVLAQSARMKAVERSVPLSICVSGFLYRRGGRGLRPVLARLEWAGGESVPEIHMNSDQRQRPSQLLQWAGGVTKPEARRVWSELALARNRRSVEDCLVRSIRRLSTGDRTIGPNSMCVQLTPWDNECHFRLRFVPSHSAETHRYEPVVQTLSGERQHKIGAFEPWIIGPGYYRPPSVVTHCSLMSSGVSEINGLRWFSDHELPPEPSPSDEAGVHEVVLFASQPRPDPPR